MSYGPAVDVLTVVTVTHNSSADMAPFLSALRRAVAYQVVVRVIVVDNASSDDTVAMVRQIMPEACVLELPTNRGYAGGVNAALAHAPHGPVLIANPHVRLHPGSVSALLEGLKLPGTGICVPRLVDSTGDLCHSLRRTPTALRAWGEAVLGGTRASRWPPLGTTVGTPSEYLTVHPVDWATGSVMLISSDCRTETGSWDESYFMYSEEVDYAMRAKALGHGTTFVPDAVATHVRSRSYEDPRLWSTAAVNKIREHRKRNGAFRSAAFAAGVIANEALRAAAGSTRARAALATVLRSRPLQRVPRQPASGPPGVVCFSSVDWWYHNRAHSDVQLMRHLARDQPVLFVNSIGMRMPLPGRSPQPLRRIGRKMASVAHALSMPLPDVPQFHVLSVLVFPFYGIRLARVVNARLVALQVRLALRRIGMDRPHCIVTVPTAAAVVELLDVRSLVVNRSDRHSDFGEVDQAYIRSLEGTLLTTADRVLYVSRALLESDSGVVGNRAHFLDHGVDLEHFAPSQSHPEPSDVALIPRPRVGFFGGIDDYVVDLRLLEKLARELPDAQLVLIGNATCSLGPLTRLPNVHVLGARSYEEIPRYGRAFDVALMPWLHNDWIEACNPIKLKEYLALGLPVVSTDFPEVRHYADVISVASGPDDFVERVRHALNGNCVGDPVSRRGRVDAASWERRAAELAQLLQRIEAV